MDNKLLTAVLLSTLALAEGVLAVVTASLYRKVRALMANQAELKNALDVTSTDLDGIKVIVDKLVANGGAANVMTQEQLDAFVAQAQATRTKADAVAEAIKALDPGATPPPPPPTTVTSTRGSTGISGTGTRGNSSLR